MPCTLIIRSFSLGEEKLDDRAKMSVAAKRSLFRVHFLLHVHFNQKDDESVR